MSVKEHNQRVTMRGSLLVANPWLVTWQHRKGDMHMQFNCTRTFGKKEPHS